MLLIGLKSNVLLITLILQNFLTVPKKDKEVDPGGPMGKWSMGTNIKQNANIVGKPWVVGYTD